MAGINDPSNWAEISGSFAAPVLGTSPPWLWNALFFPDQNQYYFESVPPVDGLLYRFTGIQYIGPALVGTLQINWNDSIGQGAGGVLTVANQSGQLATLTLPLPGGDIAATSGVLGIPMTLSSGVKIAFIDPYRDQDGSFGYFMALGITFSFVPGSGTGPVTGGDGGGASPATGFGRNIWRPRVNATS